MAEPQLSWPRMIKTGVTTIRNNQMFFHQVSWDFDIMQSACQTDFVFLFTKNVGSLPLVLRKIQMRLTMVMGILRWHVEILNNRVQDVHTIYYLCQGDINGEIR